MRMPSSANTAPAAGISAANSGHIACARSITARSGVNARGITSSSASRATANAQPSSTDQPIIRTAAARAPSGSPAPSMRPTITWPAIAIASSTSARKMKSWNAIWCAPSDDAPTRASTAEATRNDASSAVVRTAISPPIRSSERMRVEPRQLPAERAQLHPHERDAHPGLRDHRAPCRARDPPVEAVDEQQLEHDVGAVRGERGSTAACAGRPSRAGTPGRRRRA